MISFTCIKSTSVILSISIAILRIQNVLGNTNTSTTCSISGYNLWYKSDINYTHYLQYDIVDETSPPFRSNPQQFGDGYIICYEPNPSNIEAVLETNTSDCSVDYVDFRLKGPTFRPKRNETAVPYYLFGNVGTKRRGRILDVGEYELTVSPNNESNKSETIQFDVIECGQAYTWIPPNECLQCTANQTCIGSRCVDKGYLSFHLVITGWTVTDMEMIVKTPTNQSIDYDTFYGDDITGLDVQLQGSGWENCCKCRNRWVKSIIFPTEDTAPVGKYQVELFYVDPCFSDRQRVDDQLIQTGNVPKFELQVYIDGTLLQKFHTFAELGMFESSRGGTSKNSILFEIDLP